MIGQVMLQKCFGCGHTAILPYPSDCPTCFNFPRHVRMAACEPFNSVPAPLIENPVENIPEIIPEKKTAPLHPDIRAALLTMRGDVLVLYRCIWTPVEEIPTELQEYARSIAQTAAEMSAARMAAAPREAAETPEPETLELDDFTGEEFEPAQLTLFGGAA